MRKILYILISGLFAVSCQQEYLPEQALGECVLELNLSRTNRPNAATRAVDEDLAVSIFTDGMLYKYYPAGEVPSKIVLDILEGGKKTFVIQAYTENQDTWQNANSGKGEGCYFAEQTIEMEYDEFKRLDMSVPMTNYAVSLELPPLFDVLFPHYTFSLTSGNRNINISQKEKAYFDIRDGGFSYALQATNMDGATHSHSPIQFTDVESGKLFLLKYNYDSNATSGGIEIEITLDMETEETDKDI